MRYKKNVKTLWRFNFFLWIDFHSKNLPEPYTSMRPKNTGKPCGVLSFFVVHLHSQHVPAEWETKTKQSWNLPEAYISMGPWDRKKPGKRCGVLIFFVSWSSQPEPSKHLHKRRARKACGVLILLVGWSSQPKPCRSLRLHDNKTMQPFICFSRWPSHLHPSKNLRLNEKPNKRKTI